MVKATNAISAKPPGQSANIKDSNEKLVTKARTSVKSNAQSAHMF